MDSIYYEPNEKAIAAMEECQSGAVLDELTSYDIEHLDV